MCNKNFNVSESRSIEIFSLFWHLLFKDMKYTCKSPCTKTTYTTRDRGADPYPFKTLDITFDQTVDLTHSKFSIDSYTFLTKLGGFIGIGRSSLWLFVSLLGVVQVQCKFHFIYSQVMRKLRGLELWTNNFCKTELQDRERLHMMVRS